MDEGYGAILDKKNVKTLENIKNYENKCMVIIMKIKLIKDENYM